MQLDLHQQGQPASAIGLLDSRRVAACGFHIVTQRFEGHGVVCVVRLARKAHRRRQILQQVRQDQLFVHRPLGCRHVNRKPIVPRRFD